MLKFLEQSKKVGSNRQLDIENINDGVLKISREEYRVILKASSLNFELKNEQEQDSIIDSYENFLNGLSFPIQILVRTRELNIKDYLNELLTQEIEETDHIYKSQISNYSKYIEDLVRENKIISRSFYIVIGLNSKLKDQKLIRDQLMIKADLISKNLSKIGISTNILDSLEIIDLFYTFYSPSRAKNQPISEISLLALDEEYVRNYK
jgi:hypothetical protein